MMIRRDTVCLIIPRPGEQPEPAYSWRLLVRGELAVYGCGWLVVRARCILEKKGAALDEQGGRLLASCAQVTRDVHKKAQVTHRAWAR